MLRGRWCREALAPEKKKGPTKWEGPPGTICHGVIMDRLFLRRRHRLPKRGARWRQVVEDHAGNVGRVRSEAKLNGVLRNPYHPPGVTIYIEKNIYIEKRLTDQSY